MVTPAAGANTPLCLTGMDDVEQSIARAFEATMQNLVQTDLATLERTRRIYASHLDEILARCMRKRNAASSFQSRLPDELWSAIWEDEALTLSDWISFSHVCHAWRRLALLSPRLWRDISFVTRSPPECSCQACLDDEISHLEVQFARLDALLQRSSPLPFNLWFKFSCPDNDRLISSTLILRLAHAFAPHTHRLAEIDAEFHDMIKFCLFLGLLETLPALRVFTYGSTVDQRVSLPISKKQMPVLENLKLWHWNTDYELGPFPLTDPLLSVKEMSCTFTCADDLLRLFWSFPCLETVKLCPVDGDLAADFSSALNILEIRRLAAKVRDVTLVEVFAGQEALFLDMFHAPERKEMTIEFHNPPHPASLSSLADLRESDKKVGMTVTYSDESSVRINAEISDERRRQFRFPYRRLEDGIPILSHVFSRMWEYIPLSSVDTLIVESATWPAIPPFTSTPTAALGVVVRDEERYPFPWSGPHPAHFSALQCVILTTTGPWRGEVAAKNLVQFVKSLNPEGKGLAVEVLLRRGVSVVGHDDELRALCGL